MIQWTATRTEVQTAWRLPALDAAGIYHSAADFLNYKHRVDRDRAKDHELERVEVLRQLLPAIDDLERALYDTPRDLMQHPWAQGIALARERFLEALRQVGVERIGHEGERFDPSVHEAVIYQEQPGAGDQHVQSVLRPGYRLGPQLLRPAQVVAVGPPRNASEGGTPTWPK